MSDLTRSIIDPARLVQRYGQALLKDIKPSDFARKPGGVDMNTPAWNYGHLSIYPDRALFTLIGRPELAKPIAGHEEMFSAKSKCQDDPAGTIYPPMEVIVQRYTERYDAFLRVLEETPDSALVKPLPDDHAFKDRFSSVAGVMNFMLSAHIMSHLGQVSAWRRNFGLGPCM
jgi:hypothetical protein